MTSPSPITSLPTDPAYGDDLAAVIVRRLEKRDDGGSWGVLKTALLGMVSFGLLPLLVWPWKFRNYVAEESLAMQELAQWIKWRGRHPAAIGPLMAAAQETRYSPFPLVAATLLTIIVAGLLSAPFTSAPFDLEALLRYTYSFSFDGSDFYVPPNAQTVHYVWVIGLCVGFGVQWLHVMAHRADVRRFVKRFNKLAEAELLPPIRARAWRRDAIVRCGC